MSRDLDLVLAGVLAVVAMVIVVCEIFGGAT